MKLLLSVVIVLVSPGVFASEAPSSISIHCKKTVAKAILKKHPSIRRNGGSIDLNDINQSYDTKILEVSLISRPECMGGVEVKVEYRPDGQCDVKEISELDEQC